MNTIHAVLRVSLAVAVLAATSACVSSGRYDKLAQERSELHIQNLELAEQVAELEDVAFELRAELDQSSEEVTSLTSTYESLVDELRGEVASGQIEIRNAVDGVRLNVSDELLFPSGAFELNESGRAVLARVANQIKANDSVVWVEGHTDNVRLGAKMKQRFPTNWELAGARAAGVVRVLSEAGVAPKRLRAVSYGPFMPRATNASEEGRARNRRTEIVLRRPPAATR